MKLLHKITYIFLLFIAITVAVKTVKFDDILVNMTQDELYQEIYEYAKNKRIEPINPYVDKVWKLIPGFNGRAVNIDESYKKMKELGYFDEKEITYLDIPTKKDLEEFIDVPIYRGNPNKEMVTLNINVAFGEDYILPMLEILEKKQVKANFFIEGRFATRFPELIQTIVEKGHVIGNHSYSHADFQKIDEGKMRNEIDKTNQVLEIFTQNKIKYFAPPSGSFNNNTTEIVSENNMFTIMWTLDTIDWQNPSPTTIINRIIPKLHNGAIILMHPTKNTVAALEKMILGIENRGYKIDTLDEFLSSKRITSNKTDE